jgi:hypothetical protein
MVTLTVDEVVAMGQHMRTAVRRRDREGSAWKVFWLGGSAEGCGPDVGPDLVELPERPRRTVVSGLWGAGISASSAAVAVLGTWLLVAPSVFDVSIRSRAADVAHIAGAAVIVFAVIALAEVVRTLRLVNTFVGIISAIAVWPTAAPARYRLAVVITGLAIGLLSGPRGRVRHRYGTWHRLTR